MNAASGSALYVIGFATIFGLWFWAGRNEDRVSGQARFDVIFLTLLALVATTVGGLAVIDAYFAT